ncbi:Helix-turn-helix domain protein [Stieleria neptunia]|uniref:Helix-turn-helix domain protein n=1 Tax=Stieleria neptunia TaxID=2527979 RepID=A0A518HKR3_9BACT|nr:Helix-turn-helix domain protein [Stieleria neptunia]
MKKKKRDRVVDDSNHLLTLAEVARIANVKRDDVDRWIETGGLKSFPMPGSTRRRVRRRTLNAFLAELRE